MRRSTVPRVDRNPIPGHNLCSGFGPGHATWTPGWSRTSWCALATLGLLAMASLAWGGYHALTGSADLMRRVEEVQLVVRGLDPYLDPDMTYPPTAPAVFVPLVAPLAGWPLGLRAVWLAMNLGALGWIGRRITRSWGSRWPSLLGWGVLLAIAASKPVRLSLGMGQFSLIPLASLLQAIALAERGRAVGSGMLLAVALVKPTMILPVLVVLAVKGHLRALAIAGGLQALAWLAVSAWLGLPPGRLLQEWLILAAGQQGAGLIDAPSVLARIWPGASTHAGRISLAVLVIGSGWIVACRRAPVTLLVAFAGFVAAVMVYHRPYDLVLLIPTLAVLVDSAWRSLKERSRTGGLGPILAAVLFAGLLIAPAHPRVIPESTYEAFFIPAAYGYLAWIAIRLWGASRAGGEPSWPRTVRAKSRESIGRSETLATLSRAGNDPEPR